MKILCAAGARPNFMKIAPIVEALRAYPEVEVYLAHTGQHYDDAMSGVFFRELGIPEPDVNLGVASESGVDRIAAIQAAFKPVVTREKPDFVLVVGDVDGSYACASAAAEVGASVVHVEAGLRSFDERMPEERNRKRIDSLSELLFCTERAAVDNLTREGIASDKIFFVGNVMIDTLLKNLPKAKDSDILRRLDLRAKEYAVVTLHRPGTVDDPIVFADVLSALDVVQRDVKLVFPIHPRTRRRLASFGLDKALDAMPNVVQLEPLGYLELLALNANAKFVMTDSGGLQEETTALRVPCLTLRENTERPVTCEVGSAILAGVTRDGVLDAYRRMLVGELDDCQTPELWDGNAAKRVAQTLVERSRRKTQTETTLP